MFCKHKLKSHQYIRRAKESSSLSAVLLLALFLQVSPLSGALASEKSSPSPMDTADAVIEKTEPDRSKLGDMSEDLAKRNKSGDSESNKDSLIAPQSSAQSTDSASPGSTTTTGDSTTSKTSTSPADAANTSDAPSGNSNSATTNKSSADKDSSNSATTNKSSADAESPKPVTPNKASGDLDSPKSDAPKKKRKTEFADVLPTLTWIDPDVDPKAIILCVHGLGLHNDSYEAFGKTMSKLGYLVYAVDVPGFGSFKAAEGRERIDFDYCLRGIEQTLHFIHKVNPKMPIFILGESMGGAIALRFTSQHPDLVAGLVSSVPSGDRFKQGKETLRVGLKLLTAPNKEFDIGSSVINRATSKDDLKERWEKDPLNRMQLTPKELVRFQDFMNDNHESAKSITNTPVLFVQGCKDTLVRPEGTMQLYNQISSQDRELELIHDGEHLIFEENQFNDQVIKKLDKWLSSHLTTTNQLGSK